MDDDPRSIARDVAAIARISAVPALLHIVCENSGMRFAAVARVTDGSWTACAVEDQIDFGLAPGGQLDVHTTLCKEARAERRTVVFDHASQDPVYRNHPTPRLYSIESYISVPIVKSNGDYFGNLCAIDPEPQHVSDPKIVSMFEHFAELIGRQLDSEQRQQETESALLDARATAELREQFIAVLGHDLRNPLASVGAIAELLARKPDDESARYGQRLRASTRRMSRLIDDVLDLARGRMGTGIAVRIARIEDLEFALRNVVAELKDAHPDRVIVETYAVRDAVECDLGRVQQLLSNLLANALNYGAAGEPVEVAAQIDSSWLTISVKNGGPPIPAADLQKIFEPYWRPPQSAPGGGLGLGLHICSQIVRAHGGALEVTSDPNAGTCFTARLPTRRAVAAMA